ncbi:Cyclic AMP-responsive element-binding protein 5, partial [Tupaia chinensis]
QIYEESKMNLEQERPFVCSAPGCSQRFPTEDHLMIHRHKHEMTLKFPSIKTDNMLSDQTPTPTRFLKNCEEVGLFNELDCSLEHEFRKAQEEEGSKRSCDEFMMGLWVGDAAASASSHPWFRLPCQDISTSCSSFNGTLWKQYNILAVAASSSLALFEPGWKIQPQMATATQKGILLRLKAKEPTSIQGYLDGFCPSISCHKIRK